MAEDMQFLPKKDILSLEEIEEVCRVFMKLGTRKIRLTGGEPLVRKGIMQVINNLGKDVGDSTRRGRKFRDKQNKTWIKLRGINLDESGGNGLKSGESLENRDR